MLNAFKKKEGNKKETIAEKSEVKTTVRKKDKPSIYKIILEKHAKNVYSVSIKMDACRK